MTPAQQVAIIRATLPEPIPIVFNCFVGNLETFAKMHDWNVLTDKQFADCVQMFKIAILAFETNVHPNRN